MNQGFDPSFYLWFFIGYLLKRSHKIPWSCLWKLWMVLSYELETLLDVYLFILWDFLNIWFPAVIMISNYLLLILNTFLDFLCGMSYLINYFLCYGFLIYYLTHWILVTHPFLFLIFQILRLSLEVVIISLVLSLHQD